MTRTHKIRPIATLIALALIVSFLPVPPAVAGYAEGMECYKQKNWDCVIVEFAPEVEAHPEYDFGWFMTAIAQLQKKEYDKAIENFNKAIAINGDKLSYYVNKAKAYIDREQYPKVIETLEGKDSLEGSAGEMYALNYQLGTSYHKTEQHGKAVPYLEKAVAVKPDFASYYMLGTSYSALNQDQKAIGALKDALKQKPGDAEVEAMLANTYLEMAQRETDKTKKEQLYTETVSHASKAVEKKPNDYLKQNTLARAYLGANKYPQAEDAFKKVLSLKPNYCFAQINLGKVYIAKEQWNDAVKILSEGAKCAPDNSVGWESLGFAQEKVYKSLDTEQAKISQLEKALASFKKAQSIKPSNSLKEAIDRVQNNIDIANQNIRIAQGNIRTMEANLAALKKNKADNQATLEQITKTRQFFLDKDQWPDEKEKEYQQQKSDLEKAMAELDKQIAQQEKELEQARANPS